MCAEQRRNSVWRRVNRKCFLLLFRVVVFIRIYTLFLFCLFIYLFIYFRDALQCSQRLRRQGEHVCLWMRSVVPQPQGTRVCNADASCHYESMSPRSFVETQTRCVDHPERTGGNGAPAALYHPPTTSHLPPPSSLSPPSPPPIKKYYSSS